MCGAIPHKPHGIVSFEFLRFPARATRARAFARPSDDDGYNEAHVNKLGRHGVESFVEHAVVFTKRIQLEFVQESRDVPDGIPRLVSSRHGACNGSKEVPRRFPLVSERRTVNFAAQAS